MRRFLTLLVAFVVFGVSSALAQTKQVSGKVVGSDNLPIPGVNVMVKGAPTVGTMTDATGNFTIKNVPANGKILVFRFVGYETLELPISGSTVNASLKAESKLIDEVMVVAYGTAKKTSFTGSAAVIKKDDIVKTSGGVAKAIQGKVAGVQVVGDDIRIRGFGSFSASGTPLYVVDGIVDAPRPRDEDVETFTVLKDAASTALYGSRAANGVIIISSKKGKKDQKPEFTVKYQKGVISIVEPKYDLMNADEHFRTIWVGIKNLNSSKLPATSANVIKQLNKNNPYNMADPLDANGNLKPGARMLYSTDWRKEGIKDATYDQVDLSATGGSDKSTYYWSLGYTDAQGHTSNDNSKKIQSLLNFSTNLTNRLEVGLNSTIGYTTFGSLYTDKANENNLLYVSRVLTPCAPLYQQNKNYTNTAKTEWTYQDVLDEDGNTVYDWQNPNYKDYNPIALLKMDPQKGYGFRTYLAPWLSYKIIDGLVFKANAAVRFNTNKNTSFQNPWHGSGQTERGLSTHEAYHDRKWNTHASLNYEFKLAEVHNFNLFAGVEREEKTYELFNGTAAGYDLPSYTTELSSGLKPKETQSETIESGLLSYISFLKYNYDSKYYFDASFRRDGSSKFGSNKRWGNFWSVGFSWRLNEEEFLKNISWIDNLKYRISYGVTGTDEIDAYRAGDYYSIGASNYMGQTGITHTNLPNIDLGWEQNNSLSTGVDFSFFNTLSGSVEFYNKNTKDLLMDINVPYTTGFKTIFKNVGEIQNRGLEVELNANLLKNNELKWTPSFTLTYNKNKIISLPQDEIINGTKRYAVGTSLYDFYLREWAGVDPQTGAPQWYKEVEKDGVKTKEITNSYDDATRFMIGRSTPDAMVSLSNSFTYKGFDFSFQIYASLGGKLYDGEYADLMHDGANKVQELATDALNSWKTPGDITDVPKFVLGNLSKSNKQSTRYIVDGSFYKLKNISLGWNLPTSWMKRASISSARLFVTGDNLVIISDFKSGDPERFFSGVADNLTLPNTRVWRFGVAIKF